MRAKRVIAGRGMGGTYTLQERREADADGFSGESETLRPGNIVSWARNSKSTHVVRPVCPSGQIVKNVMPAPGNRATRLRANGNCFEFIVKFPFMVSPPKHEMFFFSNLLSCFRTVSAVTFRDNSQLKVVLRRSFWVRGWIWLSQVNPFFRN